MTKQLVRRDPIFVIGYKRSGTTMLRLMLNRHSNICIPSEWGCFQDIPKRYRNKIHQKINIDKIIASLPKYYSEIYNRDSLVTLLENNLPAGNDTLIACLYQSCIDAMNKNKQNCRWGDKKPQHWQFVNKLKKWYPNSQFIYIVRDPRDTIASILDYTRKGVELTRFKFVYNLPLFSAHTILAWHIQYSYNEMVKQEYLLGEQRFLSLTYESLVQNPSQELERMCLYLYLSDNQIDTMVNFNQSIGNSSVERVSVTASLHSQETKNKISKKNIGRFSKFLTQSQVADIEFICSDLLQEKGYILHSKKIPFIRKIYLSTICFLLSSAWKITRAIRIAFGSL